MRSKEKHKIHLVSLGCPKNTVDSERMLGLLGGNDYALTTDPLEADVVIVNHHLLLADLALKEEGFGELLPGADAVVVDEAHQLPDIAQQFFGVTVSSRELQRLARDVLAEARAAGLARQLEPVKREV